MKQQEDHGAYMVVGSLGGGGGRGGHLDKKLWGPGGVKIHSYCSFVHKISRNARGREEPKI